MNLSSMAVIDVVSENDYNAHSTNGCNYETKKYIKATQRPFLTYGICSFVTGLAII